MKLEEAKKACQMLADTFLDSNYFFLAHNMWYL